MRRIVTVCGACLTQFTVIGLLFSYGLFFDVFQTEFGWSRQDISTAVAVSFFMMGTLAIFGGRLSDRYGPRIVLGTSGLLFGIGVALMSQITQIWQLTLIFATFIGLGMSTHDVVTLGTVARWYERRRGIMTAIVKIGTAVGQFTIPPVAALMILAIGWRDTVLFLGVLASVLLVLAAVMMSPAPKPATTGAATATGMSFAEARSSRVFWTLCAIQFLFFPALTTVPLHIAAHGTDLGMRLETAATLLSVVAAASVLGRLAVGTLTDRIGGKNAFVICFVPLILSTSALLIIETPTLLFGVMALYGFGHGGFFTVVSPTVAALFGTRAHGAIFGIILFSGTLCGSIAPILAGRIFDQTGAYDLAFGTLAAMAVLGLGLVLTLPSREAVPKTA